MERRQSGRAGGGAGREGAEGEREGGKDGSGWLVGDALPLSFNIVLSHAIVLAPIPEQKPVGQDRAAGRPHTMPSIFIVGHNNPRGRQEGRGVCVCDGWVGGWGVGGRRRGGGA